MRAVLWGFLGVRRGDGHQEDMASLSFVHVIIAAVIGVIGFMTILLLIQTIMCIQMVLVLIMED